MVFLTFRLKSCQETEKLLGKTVNLGQISFSARNFGVSRQEILGKMSPTKTIRNSLMRVGFHQIPISYTGFTGVFRPQNKLAASL